MGSRLRTLRVIALALPISSLIGRGVRSSSRFTYTAATAANTNASARLSIVRKPNKPDSIVLVICSPPEPSKTPQDATPHCCGRRDCRDGCGPGVDHGYGGNLGARSHAPVGTPLRRPREKPRTPVSLKGSTSPCQGRTWGHLTATDNGKNSRRTSSCGTCGGLLKGQRRASTTGSRLAKCCRPTTRLLKPVRTPRFAP